MTDILLDQEGGNWVVVDASVLKVAGADLVLDSSERRGGRPGHRRALVHDFNDGLTINFNRDYTGGVTVENARVRLQVNSGPELPKAGTVGELYMMWTTQALDNIPVGAWASLWLCVPNSSLLAGDAATWQEIPLGEQKIGTG